MSRGFFSCFAQWLNPPRCDDAATVISKLERRCSAEIAARLVRRAEIHEQRGGYVARCSPMDRVAAARILELERRLLLFEHRDAEAPRRDFDRMLNVLREP